MMVKHKVLLVKALKWQQQNRNPSILLRGYNLQQAQNWLKVAKQRREHPPLPVHEEFITESSQQPPDTSIDVFVSYSRTDSDFTRRLNEALQVQGKTTWFDQESIASGSDFQAVKMNKRVVTVLYRDVVVLPTLNFN
ncbi:MAG: toll/interleukin-1 receptor domain-containing protein [Coleofasciculus sp. G3-WIS-01]